MAPHFARIAAEFYDRIREHEAAHEILSGEEQIHRLQRSLVAWLERLFRGVYDEAYFLETERIGRTHVRAGLKQHYMVAAMALVRSSLHAVLDDGTNRTARDALDRLLDVELAVMVGAYHEDASTRERDQQHRRLAALGTLAAGLAHEIRNPLNGATLHTAYLERQLAGEPRETLEAVRVVKDEIQRLARLVDEFLEFAQPRALAPTPIAVRALVGRVVRDTPSVREDLPAVEIVFVGDPSRLEQALRALVTNAVEAGALDVIVRVRREPRFVVFDVEDDGPGFDASAPVFDAFYTTKASGTGLGLTIAHRIAIDHGGTIDAYSRPGCTRFRLKLPCAQEGTTT